MPTSTFGWLDHDAEQARRSAELIRALTEPDTVDSIGIGAIRDGFAGIFFPGTSTVQTRARYFLMVPWAMQLAAKNRPRDKAQYDRILRDVEVRTIMSLLDGNDPGELGIIGRNRKGGTKRLASSVYWAALGEWGVRVAHDLSLSGYRGSVLARRGRELLEGETGDSDHFQVWDEMPIGPPGFPDQPLDILPSREEAEYLLARMASTSAGGLHAGGLSDVPSLLAGIAQNPISANVANSWDVPGNVAASDDLRDALGHAQAFSLVIQGARLRYLTLLYDAQRKAHLPESDGEDELLGLVAEWLSQMSTQSSLVSAWVSHLSDMYELVSRFRVHIGGGTRDFVAQWCAAAEHDPTDAMTSPQTATLVIEREFALKTSNARLVSPSALQAWDGSLFGSRPLDYRWAIAQNMLLDCVSGLVG
jgi:hypothetical protein